MTLSEMFPLTHASYPQIAPWDEDFDWRTRGVDVCDLIVRLQHRLIEENDERMLALSATIRTDIIQQTARAPDEATASE